MTIGKAHSTSNSSVWVGVCADILTAVYTSSNGDPSYKATAQIEVWCNDASGQVPCLQIELTGAGLYRQSNTTWTGDNELCISNCVAGSGGRYYFTENVLTFNYATWEPKCMSDPNGATALWTVSGQVDVVPLAGSNDIYSPGPSTGHYFVCGN